MFLTLLVELRDPDARRIARQLRIGAPARKTGDRRRQRRRRANARLRTQPHEILIAADGIARAVERERFLIELERLNPVDWADTGTRDSEAIILIVDAPGVAMDSVATQIGPAAEIGRASCRERVCTFV